MKTIRNINRKYKLYTQWEQLSGNWNIQRIKKEATRNGNESFSIIEVQIEQRVFLCQAALEQNNWQ
jgi:hypothetical protein